MAQAHFEPTWATIKRPTNYPVGPAVGKPEMIIQYNGNTHSLYHRLSPYTDYDKGLLGKLLGDTEPFYYIYPDQKNDFPNSALRYDSRLFPLGSGIIDVIRTSKFLVSGRGLTFLAKQFLLQTGNAFNETRIYNPTSPIVAAGLTLTLGSARPMRFFDTSAGLAGIATALLGNLGGSIFGPPKQNPVSGTAFDVNSDALPDANKGYAAKGNLRAGTALRGQALLKAQWPGNSGGKGLTGNFLDAIGGMVTSLFQNFIPQRQTNIHFRSDEGAYGMMLATDFKFSDGNGYTLGPTWVAGNKGTQNIRKKGEYPNAPFKFYAQSQNGMVTFTKVSTLGTVTYSVPTVGAVGYSPSQSGNTQSPGWRYEDAIGANVDDAFEASEMMVQYKFYQSQDFPTKDPDNLQSDTIALKASLDKVLTALREASEGTYVVNTDENSVLLMSSDTTYDYNRLFQTKNKGQNPTNYKFGALKAYRDAGVRMVSTDIATGAQNSLKMATAGKFDAINVLNVLDNTKSTGSPISGWDVWKPFEDDSIACFFYDVVNDKFIPFRSAIKGLNEAGNASWEELPFIGRADKVYSYGGFTRNCSFTIQILINSIKELGPTWQRINYMMTSIKPANYTKAPTSDTSVYNRFMVPPMFFLTLGDFYRDQPVIVQSVVGTVPEDAIWETQNEDNHSGGWDYMAGLITAPGVKYGQVPRNLELAFTLTLLEKERAVVGGANFGHAPRQEDWKKFNTNTPNGGQPNRWNQNYLVDVIKR